MTAGLRRLAAHCTLVAPLLVTAVSGCTSEIEAEEAAIDQDSESLHSYWRWWDWNWSGRTAGSGAGGTGGTGGVQPDAAGSTATAGSGGSAETAGSGAPTSSDDSPHCMDGITDYARTGPFSVSTRRSGLVNIWVPRVPSGCKVPVVHLANGTGASCSTYGSILQHLASHGFLAACYEDPNTGQGTQCIDALETLFREYPDLADMKIGSTGHSQGGGAALMCVYRAEERWGASAIYAGHAMEPAHGYGDSPSNWATYYGMIESPVFMFNGSSDSLVSASWVQRGFNALDDSVEAYWYEATGAAHIPIPTRWTKESTVVWFRWKLLDDTRACEYFKAMPDSADWSYRDSQSETGC